MRTVLEGKYELAIEDFSHPKKIVARGGDNSFGTKKNVHSSWSDSLVGVESPTLPQCRKKYAARPQNFLRLEHLQSSISRSVEKSKEISVARKEKTKIPIVGCTMRSGYVMSDEFHLLVNQQASMPKCDQKKKVVVGGQNFLGATKQHNKHCYHSFSEICSPPKEHKKKSDVVKWDENRGVLIAESSSPAQESGNNCAIAIDTRKELSTWLTTHAPNEPLPCRWYWCFERYIFDVSRSTAWRQKLLLSKGNILVFFSPNAKLKIRYASLLLIVVVLLMSLLEISECIIFAYVEASDAVLCPVDESKWYFKKYS
jgi:hypothetical protein